MTDLSSILTCPDRMGGSIERRDAPKENPKKGPHIFVRVDAAIARKRDRDRSSKWQSSNVEQAAGVHKSNMSTNTPLPENRNGLSTNFK